MSTRLCCIFCQYVYSSRITRKRLSSENVTWGQRKRFADGKVSFAYSRVLGLDKGPDGRIVVNPQEAEIVRLIFSLFLEGLSPHSIAAELTRRSIKTPGGKDVWNQQTVRRMLSNEKYKGDALLQKEFTVDFLNKKMKKNEGEVPQYYVEGNHEAIINPTVFDMVQAELVERYNTAKVRYDEVARVITEKETQNERLADFIRILKAQDDIIGEFDERLWSSMVDFMTVGKNKEMAVAFRDGTEITA